MTQFTQLSTALQRSFGLLALAVGFILLLTLVLEPLLADVPTNWERSILAITVVLPALLGAISARVALRQPKRRIGLGVLALVLNSVVALYFSLLLLIAG